jgi:site-specific DNA-methyltransferase (adenine-specific)
MAKARAPRNRTLTLTVAESARLSKRLLHLRKPVTVEEVLDRTVQQDTVEALKFLPDAFVDLLIIDPPYNKNKSFGSRTFALKHGDDYAEWMRSWFVPLLRTLKPTASVYVCSDWQSSSAIHDVLAEQLIIRNRITWEREKGRGARANWKSTAEDIWFCTVGDDYYFDVDAVKLRRAVRAPYRENGKPKDWVDASEEKYRLTHPSNFWSDLTVPFWSMPENTDHPTQKPEKLIAKLILASSRVGDIVFDPFLGSGTTSVVAKKLARHYLGIEREREYALLSEKRLELATADQRIQGYEDGIFRERNSK